MREMNPDKERLRKVWGDPLYSQISSMRPGLGSNPSQAERAEMDNRLKMHALNVGFKFKSSSRTKLLSERRWKEYYNIYIYIYI